MMRDSHPLTCEIALCVEEIIPRFYKKYIKIPTLIQMLLVIHVTDFPPTVERTKKYVLCLTKREQTINLHLKRL
jgi:hypothetical protein